MGRGSIGGQYYYRDFYAEGAEAYVPPNVTDRITGRIPGGFTGRLPGRDTLLPGRRVRRSAGGQVALDLS